MLKSTFRPIWSISWSYIMKNSKKDVREIIINAASGIFARFGFKKATVKEIAQAAHKAKSSIYHYFKSKNKIFKAVVEKESELLKKEIIKSINKEDTPQKKIRAYIITRMKVLNNLANFYNALKDEYLNHYGFIEKLREKHYADEIIIMKKILKNGVDEGIFLIRDLETTAYSIITALKSLEYSWVIENNVSMIEKKIDNLLEILFNGLVKK